jgi:hypothetical protein
LVSKAAENNMRMLRQTLAYSGGFFKLSTAVGLH